MKSRLIVAAVTLFAITSLASAATKKKKPAAHSNAVHATYTSGSRRASKVRGKSSARGKGRRGLAASRRGPARQLTPTPDRYMEIQKALADRGFLKTAPSGVWDSASQDAMRAFQNDHKLDASGKLTAASLIALGLGAKHDSPVVPGRAEAAPRPVDSAPLTSSQLSPSPER